MSANNNRKPARWSDFDRYLKAEHLQEKAFTVTLARVEVQETHPRPGVTTLVPVAYFRETTKGLILSPTNQDALARLFGDDVAGCIGQSIAIKAEHLHVAGRDTQPIRIYAATGQAPHAQDVPPESDAPTPSLTDLTGDGAEREAEEEF
jgi:hypothetical protein